MSSRPGFSPCVLFLYLAAVKLRPAALASQFRGLKIPLLFLGMYFLLGSLSLVVNEDLYHIGKFGLLMFAPLTLFASIVVVMTDDRKISRVLMALFWIAVLLSLFVLYAYDIAGISSWRDKSFTMRYMLSDSIDNMTLSLNYHQSDKFYGFSRTLRFIEEPAFAAMLSPLILYGFFVAARGGKYKPILYYAASFFLGYTLLNTTSRVGFLAFISGLMVFLWLARKKRLHCLLVILVTSLLILSNPFMQYRLLLLAGVSADKVIETFGIQAGQDAARPAMIKALLVLDREIKKRAEVQKDGHVESVGKTIEDVKGAPFFGHGITAMIEKYGRGPWQWGLEHNRYLYIAATAGMLTVIPYVLFILALAALSFRTLRPFPVQSGGEMNLGVILFASVLLFGVQLINCGQERYYYWVFFGLAAAWIRNTTLTESHENPSH